MQTTLMDIAAIQYEWSALYRAGSKAEGMANTDARTSCFYACSRALELAVDWLYKHDKSLCLPCQDNQRRQDAGYRPIGYKNSEAVDLLGVMMLLN